MTRRMAAGSALRPIWLGGSPPTPPFWFASLPAAFTRRPKRPMGGVMKVPAYPRGRHGSAPDFERGHRGLASLCPRWGGGSTHLLLVEFYGTIKEVGASAMGRKSLGDRYLRKRPPTCKQ